MNKEEIELFQDKATGEIVLPQTYYESANVVKLSQKIFGQKYYQEKAQQRAYDQSDWELKHKVQLAHFRTNQHYASRAKPKFYIGSSLSFHTEESLMKNWVSMDPKFVAERFKGHQIFEDSTGVKVHGIPQRQGNKENWEDRFCDLRVIV